MAITINRATLARQVNGEIEYIYPKSYADLIEYDSTQNVKEKIDSIVDSAEADLSTKLNKPLNEDGIIYNGSAGQVLQTNGDGTTSWVTPIDKVDPSLSMSGVPADASAVGDAIDTLEDKDIEIMQLISNLQTQIDNDAFGTKEDIDNLFL